MTQVDAPAKINWFLYVLNKRGDGFHDILSAMQKITLYDSLEMRAAPDFQVKGDAHFEDNIMLKAVEAVKRYCGIEEKGLYIGYRKQIPVSAGLGGGSSDAAAVIASLNDLWDLRLSKNELFLLGEKVGSDVPFFLGSNFAVAAGRGEALSPFTLEKSYDLLLVNPGISISSGWAYQANLKYIAVSERDAFIKGVIDALNLSDYHAMAGFMINSLEEQVFKKYPLIGEIKRRMLRQGAVLSLMSGSGSTVFGVFPDREDAISAQKHFSEYWTAVVKTLI